MVDPEPVFFDFDGEICDLTRGLGGDDARELSHDGV